MSDKIETEEQQEIFFLALNILINNNFVERSSLSPAYHSGAQNMAGYLFGCLKTRYINDLEISKTVLDKTIEEIQDTYQFGGFDGRDRAALQGFIARLGEYVNEAYDIAMENKPLPDKRNNTEARGLMG